MTNKSLGKNVLRRRREDVIYPFATTEPELIYSISKLENDHLVKIRCRKEDCGLMISSMIENSKGLLHCKCGEVYHVIIMNPHLVKIKTVTRMLRKCKRRI